MKVNLALVGLGRWSMLLYSFLREMESAVLAAGYDSSPETAARFAEIFEPFPLVQSLEEILKNESIRGVIVVTANDTHLPVALQCLSAGKDVFIEKPIATTLAEADQLIGAAEQQGRILMVGHNSRRYAAVRKMKELITAGRIGRVVTAHATFSYDNLEEITRDTWRNDPRKCPGGPLLQLGVHHADNLTYLLGPVESVTGRLLAGPAECKVPAGGSLLLKFTGGALGTITSDYCTAPETFSIVVRGIGGELRVSGEDQIFFTDPVGKEERYTLSGPHSVQAELDEFIRCIVSRKKPETDGRAGREALRVILHGLEAAGSGNFSC